MAVKKEKPVEDAGKYDVEKKPTKTVPALPSLYEQLSVPIPEDCLVTYTEDGKEFTGYHSQYAIDLFNKVVGLENVFTTETILKEEIINKAWLVAMKVEITIIYGNSTTTRTGYGSAFSKRAANAYKGAKTSAFKNACRYYGIGRELFYKGFDEDIQTGTEIVAAESSKSSENKTVEETTDQTGEVKTNGAEDLIRQISEVSSKEALEQLRATVSGFEAGDAVKKLLLRKFNDRLVSFDK